MHVDSLVEYIGPYILQAYESWEIDPHHKKNCPWPQKNMHIYHNARFE